MRNILFVLATMLVGYSGYSQNTGKLLTGYMIVKEALVRGDSKAASEGVSSLPQTIVQGGDFDRKEALLKASETMGKAGTIDKQRAAFNEISTILWTVVDDAGEVDGTVYYQYCPMKKAYWLSMESEIRNPYYGNAMLTCGKVVDTN